MNTQEFKAWFAGFTEAIDGVPNAKQWARIKEEAEKIRDASPLPIYTPGFGQPTTIPLIQPYATCSGAASSATRLS